MSLPIYHLSTCIHICMHVCIHVTFTKSRIHVRMDMLMFRSVLCIVVCSRTSLPLPTTPPDMFDVPCGSIIFQDKNHQQMLGTKTLVIFFLEQQNISLIVNIITCKIFYHLSIVSLSLPPYRSLPISLLYSLIIREKIKEERNDILNTEIHITVQLDYQLDNYPSVL